MSQLTIIIIIAIVLLIINQFFFTRPRPFKSAAFYAQLIGGFGMLALVWLTGSENDGRIQYKILLSAIGILSLVQCLISYLKRNGTVEVEKVD